MAQDKKKVRVGLMMDSMKVPAWTYIMLKRIKYSNYAEIKLVILNEASKKKNSYLARVMSNRHYWLFNLYQRIDRALFKPVRDAFSPKNAVELLNDVPVLKVNPKQTKYSDIIDAQDIKEIKKCEIDVLIRLGFRILKGEILDVPKFGIWSFHHGDSEVIRGGPPGFWEVFENHPVTGVTLQVLNDQLDRGAVLAKTYSSTNLLSVNRNKSNYYWNALSLLPRKLKELYRLGDDTFAQKVRGDNLGVQFSQDVRRCPKNRDFVRYLLKKILMLLKFRVGKFFFLHQWILMFDLDKGISSDLKKFRKIIPPRDRLWADPFAIYRDNRYYIFFEEMKYIEKGHISLIVMDEQGQYSDPVKVLEKPYHLSYPFIFEWGEDYYMIPESGANHTVDVYKCTQFPEKWEFQETILENIKAADTTLFFHQNKWWLFVNVQENEGASNWEELFLFFSDSPISKKWTPHPQNPVVSDVRRARPAGKIFEHDGKIYRPAQDCSISYGYGTRINQIKELSETGYREEDIRFIEPLWDKQIKGMHTINTVHKLTVIDAIYQRKLPSWYLLVLISGLSGLLLLALFLK